MYQGLLFPLSVSLLPSLSTGTKRFGNKSFPLYLKPKTNYMYVAHTKPKPACGYHIMVANPSWYCQQTLVSCFLNSI